MARVSEKPARKVPGAGPPKVVEELRGDLPGRLVVHPGHMVRAAHLLRVAPLSAADWLLMAVAVLWPVLLMEAIKARRSGEPVHPVGTMPDPGPG
jgi:hypothetical protein